MIAVIGKHGQLAKKCKELLDDDACVLLGRHDIDIASDILAEQLNQIKPTAIINASAYTAVDKAESERDNALAINHFAVKRLSNYCSKKSIHFVHVSTDYVFQGDKGSPYLPDDTYDPLNTYGESKMLGEQALLDNNADMQCILRTSWVYSEYGANFVSAMLSLMEQKEELSVIYDQIGTPTSVDTLAKVCILASKHKLQGVHHVTDEGVASWYDFAICIQKIALELGLITKSIPLKPITTAQYPTPARRPHYSVLSKESLKSELPELQLKHWQDALRVVLQKIKSTNI